MGLKVKGQKAVERWLDRIGSKLVKELQTVLIAGGSAIQKTARDNVLSNKSNDQGGLWNSIESTASFTTNNLEVEIGPTVKYGPYVEFGTQPHYPPVEPLERWAERHGMNKGAGYAIVQKIGREGTQPKPYLIPAYNKLVPKIIKRLDKTMGDID